MSENFSFLIISVSSSNYETCLIDTFKVCLYLIDLFKSSFFFELGHCSDTGKVFIFCKIPLDCDFLAVLDTKIRPLYSITEFVMPKGIFQIKSQFSIVFESTNELSYTAQKEQLIHIYNLEVFDRFKES